jgi:cytochrome P450
LKNQLPRLTIEEQTMDSVANLNQDAFGNTLPQTEAPFKFNVFDPAFHEDPYPFYDRLRREFPIYRNFMGAWVFTRYSDIKSILRDRRFRVLDKPGWIKNKNRYLTPDQGNFDALVRSSSKFFFFLEPPDHGRLRGLITKAFSASFVDRLRPHVEATLADLLGKVREQGAMDIMADLACPLPAIVIARLIGVPAADYARLGHLSDELARIFDPVISLEGYLHLNAVVEEFGTYFLGLVAQRKRQPGTDLIDSLIAAQEEGNRLSEEEVVAVCMQLFAGGEETTVNLIGNGMLALLTHPEQLELLRSKPEIIAGAVEELLRYDSSIQLVARAAIEDIEIEGCTIGAGEHVHLYLGAANRDPAQFFDPHRLDLTRADNRHLAFGDGIHHCFGGPLARVEGQVVFQTLVQQFPKLRLAEGRKPERREGTLLRGLKRLPVTF